MKTQNSTPYFARALKELRESHNLTMDEFCRRYNQKFDAKFNKSTVSRYENQAQEPMVSTVKKIAEFFHVDPSSLLGYPISETLPKEDADLLDIYHQLDREDRKRADSFVLGLLSAPKYRDDQAVQVFMAAKTNLMQEDTVQESGMVALEQKVLQKLEALPETEQDL